MFNGTAGRALTGIGKRLMTRLRKLKFLGRPFLRPEDYKERAICDKCEDKRNGATIT